MTISSGIASTAGAGSKVLCRHGSAAIAQPWLSICATLSGATVESSPSSSTIRSSVVRRHGRMVDPGAGTPLSESEIDVLDELEGLRFSWEV